MYEFSIKTSFLKLNKFFINNILSMSKSMTSNQEKKKKQNEGSN